jgi:predicted  nucleic acid-binding Zn-ribbon protein
MSSNQARVADLDAIQAFRSNLVLYLSKARAALEEVAADILRTRVWLEEEQRVRLETDLRQKRRAMEEAQEALFGARISTLREETSVEQLIYQRARRAVDAAEEKLRVLRRHAREYDNRVQPLLKQTEKLQTVLSGDMQTALAYLNQVMETLTAYAEVRPAASPPPTSTPPAPPAGNLETPSGL